MNDVTTKRAGEAYLASAVHGPSPPSEDLVDVEVPRQKVPGAKVKMDVVFGDLAVEDGYGTGKGELRTCGPFHLRCWLDEVDVGARRMVERDELGPRHCTHR